MHAEELPEKNFKKQQQKRLISGNVQEVIKK